MKIDETAISLTRMGNQDALCSTDVAVMTGILHKNVLQSVNKYISVLDGNGLNFQPVGEKPSARFFIPGTYTDAKGEARPCYYFTKMGCEFFSNKLTGEKGILFTARYVELFNEMESRLVPQSEDDLIALALIAANKRMEAMKARIRSQDEVIALQTPKAEKHDQLMASEGGVIMKGLAGFLVQNGVILLTFNDGTRRKNGQNNLYQWMREQGYLCKARGERYNLPIQKWIDAGLFALKAAVADIGGVKREVMTTVVTPKGQGYFLDLFIKKEAVVAVI